MRKRSEIPSSVQLQEVSLKISDLEYQCAIWPVPGSKALAGLIRFAGTYRLGSAGSDDALFIKWKIAEFCDVEFPDSIRGLIVDFRGMRYTWGDDLDVSPDRLRRQGAPIRVVAEEEDLKAYEYAISKEELRSSLKDSFTEINENLGRI